MAGGITEPNGPDIPNGPVSPHPIIPDHVLLRKIGGGSYGEIWLARCALGRYRAVKIVHRARFTDTRPYEREFSGIQRFEPISREHDSFVDILQVGRNDDAGFFYYVMELADDSTAEFGVKNAESDEAPSASSCAYPSSNLDSAFCTPHSYVPRTLAHEIRRRGRLPAEEVIALGTALAEGLQYLHQKGLIHRDIKPSNIIYVAGRPKLADVGLVAELSETLSVVGTIGYMPAEGPGSIQADIYSLGKVLYEAATGKDRQDFPELPVPLDADADHSKLLELNEVILNACAKQPQHRYQTTAAVLRDLERVQDGTSLVQTHARRRSLRRVGLASAVILATACLVAVVWLLYSLGSPEPAAKLIVSTSDDFDSPRIDTNKWTLSQAKWDNLGYPGSSGKHRFNVAQTNSELMLEARAQHTNGISTAAGVFLDSKADLRKFGECRIEIELSGTNKNAHTAISVSEGRPPSDSRDIESVQLLRMPVSLEKTILNVYAPLGHTRIGVDLFPAYDVAVVYPDAAVAEKYEIINLAGLRHWHLRLLAAAVSSQGIDDAHACLRIRDVKVWSKPTSRIALGLVVRTPTDKPVIGASVFDVATGAKVAESFEHGAFKFKPGIWPVRVRVEHEDFLSSDEITISGERRHPVTIELRKRKEEIGDVTAVIPVPRPVSLGVLGTNLWSEGVEDGIGRCETLLMPVDIEKKELSPVYWKFTIGDHPLCAFTQCGDRAVGTFVHPGRIYELSLSGRTNWVLVKPTAVNSGGRLIDWPYGCAFDGQFFWFVERDGYSNHFGLHGLDLQTLKVRHSLATDDNRISGVAWDADEKQFWMSSGKGEVYAVDRDKAVDAGRLERGKSRAFSGDYVFLAYHDRFLWGLDLEMKQICRIKIRD